MIPDRPVLQVLVTAGAARGLGELVPAREPRGAAACISLAPWQEVQSIALAAWTSPWPRSPKNSLPTRLPWQAVHCSTGSGRFRKVCPSTNPLPANPGRLT